MIGIYKITSPNGRIYIGQSINIEKRWKSYKTLMNSKKQIKLYRSFNKYGYENHIFEIIEECNEINLNNRERYYQNLYDVINKNGLNCILTETNILPRIFSEELKLKISNSMKGKIKSLESKNKISNSLKNRKNIYLKSLNIETNSKNITIKFKIKPIYQYDLNLNLIKIWNSYQEIIPYYLNKEILIWNCLRGIHKTSCKSIWSYYEINKNLTN